MWEFLKFWRDCIVTAWHFGDGIFSTIVEICLIIGSGLLVFKSAAKRFKWEQKWKKWEDILMKAAFLLFAASFLIAAVFVAPFLKFEGALPPIASVAPTPAPKALPTKIIPRPEPAPAVATEPTQTNSFAATETDKPFENFAEDTNDTNVAYALMQVENRTADEATKQAKIEAENDKQAQDDWNNTYLPRYRSTLKSLNDLMYSDATRNGDGISQSKDYFQCLPDRLDRKTKGFQAAEIKFQNDTNFDFIISVSDGPSRRLTISGSTGKSFEIEGDVYCIVQISPGYWDHRQTNSAHANELITFCLKEFIAGIHHYSAMRTNTP